MFYFKNCKKIQIHFKNTVRINLIHSTIRTTIFKLFFVTVDNLTETNHVIGCRNHIGDTKDNKRPEKNYLCDIVNISRKRQATDINLFTSLKTDKMTI